VAKAWDMVLGIGNLNRLRISSRQCEVLALVEAGLSDKEIALRLRISTATVKTHLNRLYRYNGFRNRAQAAAAFSRRTAPTLNLRDEV